MAAQYPTNLVTTTQLPNTRVDGTASPTNHVSDHNNLADEMIAVQAELGVLPKGGYSTVVDRLNKNSDTDNDDKIRRAIAKTTSPIFVAQTLDPSALAPSLGQEVTLSDQRLGGGLVIMEEDVANVAGIAYRVTTAGVGVSYSNFCGAALYSIDPSTFAWTRVAYSANQRVGTGCTILDNTGFKQIPFSGGSGNVNLTKGTIYLLALNSDSTAGTKSKLLGVPSAASTNDFSDTANIGRFMYIASSISSPPGASFAGNVAVQQTNSHWLALYK